MSLAVHAPGCLLACPRPFHFRMVCRCRRRVLFAAAAAELLRIKNPLQASMRLRCLFFSIFFLSSANHWRFVFVPFAIVSLGLRDWFCFYSLFPLARAA